MDGINPRRLDWTMLATILLLAGLGAAFIYSAQFKSDADPVGNNWIKQLAFAGLGLCAYFALAWLDYRRVARAAGFLYGGAILLLLLVFLFPKVNGAHRWIPLPGISFQPSEAAKIAVVAALAAYLSAPDRDADDWRTFFGCAAIAGVPFLLVAAQPDLSSALTLAPVSAAIMLHAGVRRRLLLAAMATVVLLVAAACFWIKFEAPPPGAAATAQPPKLALPRMPLLEDYQKSRIKVFLSRDHDLADAGWNKLQSQIAVGSGGLLGKGWLQGAQNNLGFLPRTVAPTDFIFCVVAEETGFAGGVAILLLYAVLLARCMRAALGARDELGRILALGIGAMLFCHVFVNIAMTIGILPITGLPLPLMSYGGSFMVGTMVALGLVQSVHLRRRTR